MRMVSILTVVLLHAGSLPAAPAAPAENDSEGIARLRAGKNFLPTATRSREADDAILALFAGQ